MKKPKVNFHRLGKRGLTFLNENRERILHACAMAGCWWLCEKLHIPMSFSANNRSTGYTQRAEPDYSRYAACSRFWRGNNPVETALLSIARNAESLSFDSDRERAARSIERLVTEHGVDDETMSLAITLLEDISDRMDFSSSKERITKIIINIAEGAM